ncbi:glycosyltransferase family 2 protein [Cycloclasticus zancles]|nr:glycosyltransferase family A protein [Cycloclasticus zancles]KXJ53207.1 MAG: hypothetical protein AXW17_06955 [Colwellia sp. Phe_37]
MIRPTVSVLMPVYNTEKYLKEAIDSILSQSYRDFEFLIVDDGSTDGSLDIIQNSANNDPRIKFVSEPNKGICATRNQLTTWASGQYLAWMDSDDICNLTRLERQIEYLKNDTSCNVVGCGSYLLDDDGFKICRWITPQSHDEIDSWHISGNGGAIIFASTMMLKSSVEQAGGFNEQLTGAEDLCLLLRLAEIGKIENISDELYFYRQHIESISHSAKVKIKLDTQTVVDAARERRGLSSFTLPCNDKENSRFDTYIKWGWWALAGKNILTSRKYAKKAILLAPYKVQAWKLLLCSVRGY